MIAGGENKCGGEIGAGVRSRRGEIKTRERSKLGCNRSWGKLRTASEIVAVRFRVYEKVRYEMVFQGNYPMVEPENF